MRTTRAATLVAGAIAAVLLGWSLLRSGAPAPAAPPLRAAAPEPIAPPPVPEAQSPPASLRDSAVDGGLATDAAGHFVPTRDALLLFDYYLSASGEEPEAALRARISAAIAQRLPPGAAREAEAFLDRYLAYRADAARLGDDDRAADGADLERRLQWLRELRRKHFGAALAATLFGDDERAVEIAVEERRIAADASLDDAQKRARFEALEQQLPASVRQAREAAAAPLRLAQEEQALRARGGSDAEVQALRERSVGPDAAARLAELDHRRAAWDQRLADYRTARDAIESDPSRDPEAKQAALETLRARRFDARERMRVRALDDAELGAAARPGAD